MKMEPLSAALGRRESRENKQKALDQLKGEEKREGKQEDTEIWVCEKGRLPSHPHDGFVVLCQELFAEPPLHPLIDPFFPFKIVSEGHHRHRLHQSFCS